MRFTPGVEARSENLATIRKVQKFTPIASNSISKQILKRLKRLEAKTLLICTSNQPKSKDFRLTLSNKAQKILKLLKISKTSLLQYQKMTSSRLSCRRHLWTLIGFALQGLLAVTPTHSSPQTPDYYTLGETTSSGSLATPSSKSKNRPPPLSELPPKQCMFKEKEISLLTSVVATVTVSRLLALVTHLLGETTRKGSWALILNSSRDSICRVKLCCQSTWIVRSKKLFRVWRLAPTTHSSSLTVKTFTYRASQAKHLLCLFLESLLKPRRIETTLACLKSFRTSSCTKATS